MFETVTYKLGQYCWHFNHWDYVNTYKGSKKIFASWTQRYIPYTLALLLNITDWNVTNPYVDSMNAPFNIADAHSCTCTSGILLANCMAGVTMFILSWLLPNDKNMCPSNTRVHEVRRFESSAFAIFNVSLKYLLQKGKCYQQVLSVPNRFKYFVNYVNWIF